MLCLMYKPPMAREEIEKALMPFGKSLRWLAREVDVNHQAMLNWLNGENAPRDETVRDRIKARLAELGKEVTAPMYAVAMGEALLPLWPWHAAGD